MIRYIIHVVSNYNPQSLLWHLSRVRGNVFEGPLNVLVAGEGAAEACVGGAAEPQQAVVGRQHRPVEVDHVGVLVVRQDVVEGDVFDDMRVVENKFDVLRTIKTSMVLMNFAMQFYKCGPLFLIVCDALDKNTCIGKNQ